MGNWGTNDAATDFSYDPAGRLSSMAHHLAGGSYDTSTSFTRNPASQIASIARSNDAYAWTGAVNIDRGYTTNGLNQYSAAGGASFAYDPNGNLTSDGSNSYLYDIENRLVSRGGAGSAALRYDPLGRLYEVSGPGGTTRLLHDGDALVAEYDAAGNMLRRYVHGDSAGDDPLVWFEGAGMADAAKRYLFADERGSIVAVTDANGNALAINSYDEFGIPGPSNQGRFQYTGQAWLPELGLYHYKARMYSPTLGRFMQTDPIGYEDQVNLYAYVGNDPVNAVDPTGEACVALNSGSPYCARASKYRGYDSALRGQTRFFSAAARTVEFLANMDYPVAGRLFTSSTTRSLLNTISSGLERANGNVALRVATGQLGGRNLDARLVHYEQSIVQAGLNSFAQSNPEGYANSIAEINGLLNAEGVTRGASSQFPSDRSYMRVLDGVRTTLGRDIDFASQSDREAIGNALTEDARKSGACDQSGTRIKSC